jgi:hypothetical protein
MGEVASQSAKGLDAHSKVLSDESHLTLVGDLSTLGGG